MARKVNGPMCAVADVSNRKAPPEMAAVNNSKRAALRRDIGVMNCRRLPIPPRPRSRRPTPQPNAWTLHGVLHQCMRLGEAAIKRRDLLKSDAGGRRRPTA